MEAAAVPPVLQTTTDLSTSLLPATTTHHFIIINCPSNNRIQNLGLIQIICAVISLLGSLSMICYFIYKRICGNREVRPLFHLVCADAGLAAFLILSSTFLKQPTLARSCVYFQILAEVFYLITFLLTANYALNVYIRMKDRYHRANNLIQLKEQKYISCFLRMGYLFSWIGPTVFVVPALIATVMRNDMDSCFSCYSLFFSVPVNHTATGSNGEAWSHYGTILFLTTILFSLLAIIVFYTLTTRVYKQLLRQQNEFTDKQRRSVRGLQKRVTLYIGVFVFCWTPASILAIIELTTGTPNPYKTAFFVLYVIQSVTAPSQGLLNSFVYGWTRRSVYSSNESEAAALNRQTVRGYGSSTTKRIYPQKPEPSRPMGDETTALFQYQT